MADRRERDEQTIELLTKALRGEMTDDDLACIGFGAETKRIIRQMIAINPAMKAAILDLAESAYMDGMDAAP